MQQAFMLAAFFLWVLQQYFAKVMPEKGYSFDY